MKGVELHKMKEYCNCDTFFLLLMSQYFLTTFFWTLAYKIHKFSVLERKKIDVAVAFHELIFLEHKIHDDDQLRFFRVSQWL